MQSDAATPPTVPRNHRVSTLSTLIPAKAGTQATSGMDAQSADAGVQPEDWIPAFAGTSG
ncbi:hypothetical protein SAMN02982931_02513 [Bauldia litoralis]|uniref:Uncharacterized protein n=1 Tax=Bauldia litoralis TaxID=665467 RepID=A0A1G6CHP9_9HYPH|nr:hypothetical protein SAMN02982931_02513 [Bauldia litoralis]